MARFGKTFWQRACTILTGKKTFCLLPGKELCQVEPEMRRFCLSTIEMRERL